MQERLINERRDWKAQVFPYDYYLPDDSPECQYCLTDKQAELLRGLVEPLGWRTRWWSATDVAIDIPLIEEYRADLVRRLMMGCCGDEDLIYTYDEDGNLEVSDDGGVTYTPAPQADIRINPKVVFPQPPTEEGVDELCLAADGMVNLIREQIGDQLTDDMSRYTLGQLISDWTNTMIGTSNPFQALVTIVTNQIFALLISAVRAALTEEVYALLRCIFSANMLADISFDVAAADNVRTDTTSQISGIAGVFLEHLEYLLGSGGLTNLARSMAGIDDSACCPECSADLWGVWNLDGVDVGLEIARGSNWITVQSVTHPDFGGSIGQIVITTGDSAVCCSLSAAVEIGGDMTDVNLRQAVCGAAIWPAATGIDFVDDSMCTVYAFKTTGTAPFQIKFTFS